MQIIFYALAKENDIKERFQERTIKASSKTTEVISFTTFLPITKSSAHVSQSMNTMIYDRFSGVVKVQQISVDFFSQKFDPCHRISVETIRIKIYKREQNKMIPQIVPYRLIIGRLICNTRTKKD